MKERPVAIHADGATLEGDLTLPAGTGQVVLFAHGSGSSRHSPRNRRVAGVLHEAGLGTLLLDLLTAREERSDALDGHLRFDVPFLARRLVAAAVWLLSEAGGGGTGIGCFGASTGGGAALVAAAERPADIACVVSRGGRPDLAGDALPRVAAPTLLIVGGADTPVIAMNRAALGRMTCEKQLVIVPGAGHLFEEPGALDEVARLARDWFLRHLA